MRDDVVLDAAVHLAGHDALIDEFIFAAIRPVSDDARRPGARHAWNLKELLNAGCVDVDARLRGGQSLSGFGWRGLKAETRVARRESAERSRQDSAESLYPHPSIFFLGR